MTAPPWYKKKYYAHFDRPLSPEHAEAIANDPERVSKHSFYPFLAFNIVNRRFKRKKGGAATVKKKVRPIRVAAHVDGYIFSRYSYELGKKYEQRISETAANSCVLAYRRKIGSNIDFASAAFAEVERRGTCVAVALDLSEFFESIDHERLKAEWASLLGKKRLPPDHYAVFKAITRYAIVDRKRCFKVLGYDKVPSKPLCSPAEFRLKIRGAGLVERHVGECGIPQGSQISSVLSNIVMRSFDEAMSQLAQSFHGYYRRYCDDILWIGDIEDIDLVNKKLKEFLTLVSSSLRVNEQKTVASRFKLGELVPGDEPLQYLGFTFDGDNKLIRSQSLSRYWRKAIFGIRAAKRRSRKAEKSQCSGILFKRKLYRRFTHLGRKNFLSYVLRSSKKMESPSMWKQMKSHWCRIQEEIKKPTKF